MSNDMRRIIDATLWLTSNQQLRNEAAKTVRYVRSVVGGDVSRDINMQYARDAQIEYPRATETGFLNRAAAAYAACHSGELACGDDDAQGDIADAWEARAQVLSVYPNTVFGWRA